MAIIEIGFIVDPIFIEPEAIKSLMVDADRTGGVVPNMKWVAICEVSARSPSQGPSTSKAHTRARERVIAIPLRKNGRSGVKLPQAMA